MYTILGQPKMEQQYPSLVKAFFLEFRTDFFFLLRLGLRLIVIGEGFPSCETISCCFLHLYGPQGYRASNCYSTVFDSSISRVICLDAVVPRAG